MSESAIKRWCKGVLELHGVNPQTPYTDTHLCYLAEFRIRCSDRWQQFKNQTGLSRRLSPAEYVQSQLVKTGQASHQQLQQVRTVDRQTISDVQDAIAERRQAVRTGLTNQVAAMAEQDYQDGQLLGSQAKAVFSGEVLLAGFVDALRDDASPIVSLLPSNQ